MSHIIIFISAFLISLTLSDFFAKNITSFTFYRVFAREKLRSHRENKEILKVGGIIIFISSIMGLFISDIFSKNIASYIYDARKFFGFATSCIIILMLGIWDDAKKIGYRTKFLWQIIAVIPLIASGYTISRITFFNSSLEVHWFGYIFMMLWILVITNAINLIDGLDGLASGISLIAFSAVAIMAYKGYPAIYVLCLAVIASLVAFLKYNFYPAKLYLGDNGSLLLGFMLGVSSLIINVKVNVLTLLSLPILVLMLPIGSVIYSFTRRIRKGKNPFIADKMHLHYLLLESGVPYVLVCFLFWISSFVLALMGVISYFLSRRLVFFMLSLGVLFLVISYMVSLIVILRGKRNGNQ